MLNTALKQVCVASDSVTSVTTGKTAADKLCDNDEKSSMNHPLSSIIIQLVKALNFLDKIFFLCMHFSINKLKKQVKALRSAVSFHAGKPGFNTQGPQLIMHH